MCLGGDGNGRNRSIKLRVRHGCSIDTMAAGLESFPGSRPRSWRLGRGLQRVVGRRIHVAAADRPPAPSARDGRAPRTTRPMPTTSPTRPRRSPPRRTRTGGDSGTGRSSTSPVRSTPPGASTSPIGCRRSSTACPTDASSGSASNGALPRRGHALRRTTATSRDRRQRRDDVRDDRRRARSLAVVAQGQHAPSCSAT